MKQNLNESLYDELILFLQDAGGASDLTVLMKAVLDKHPKNERRLEELIWHLITHQKLTHMGSNIVSLNTSKLRQV